MALPTNHDAEHRGTVVRPSRSQKSPVLIDDQKPLDLQIGL